jgi:Fe-S oxidoreductase
MNPILMTLVIVGLVGAFALSASRRYRLLRSGTETWESRFDRLKQRLGNVWTFAFWQKKMRYYWLAGVAHQLIFLGFVVLLLRTLVLWGRGFDPSFNLFVLGPEPVLGLPLGTAYNFAKDSFALLVLLGVAVFVYFRAVRREQRMTLSGEGLVILGIIATMMLADLSYDGASLVLRERAAECASSPSVWCQRAATVIAPLGPALGEVRFLAAEPGGSLMALALSALSTTALVIVAHAGFWLHSSLVLIFLNILPYTKHFHIITAIPNVLFGDLTPRGRLRPLAPSTEALMAAVEKASENEDVTRARIGYARIEHFPWKDVLDFYTCTECGRCSDNCPATRTGKVLSPKHLTLALRDHLYEHENVLVGKKKEGAPEPKELVPHVIQPEVLWACTTCRACEEQCPVNITYVDKIVQMRRHLVTMKGEFPAELSKPFEGMEGNGNPWNLARVDRSAWTDGLEIKRFADKPDAEVLFWVGCAASYDDRAKKIARATVRLLQAAGVDFAILAEEESCTGDPARRAGNEYLYSMLAEANVATLNGYKEQGGLKEIITTCPHCFNTLANEYPDFGGKYSVVHSADFLLGLMASKKLVPTKPVRAKVAYHDSCYLGRYNDIYESPREILRRIEGVELVEVQHWNKKRGLCCGAGGAQMFMEEQNNNRVNVNRTQQLLDTGAQTIASACPFCMTMLKDGVKAHNKEETIQNLDIVEVLAAACGLGEPLRTGAEDGGAAAAAE